MTDNVRLIWTEEELDTALATLHDKPTGKPDLAGAKAELLAALGQPQPAAKPARRWRWPAAAAVAAVIGGVAVAETVLSGPAAPTASAAAAVLHRAAVSVVREQDPVAGPSQYTYIRTDSWASAGIAPKGGRTLEKLVEVVAQTWVPTDRSRDWLLRRAPTGHSTWLVGSDAEATAAGAPANWLDQSSVDSTAPCGDFFPPPNTAPSCADTSTSPGWQNPTPAWLAGLPTDPAGMLSRLRADAPDNTRGDAELVTYVNDALQTGLVPAKVRAVLYQALALLPDLTVTQNEANLAGRTGVAMGVDDPADPTRADIIIDPATGQYIGARTVQLSTRDGIKAGTVIEFSAVTTSVVDGLGEQPK
jgi:hypothetical protein